MQLLEMSDVVLEFSDMRERHILTRPNLRGKIIEPERKSGVHLSGILKYIAIEIGVLKPGEPLEEEMPLRFAVGHAMEEFLASLYPEMDWQPGPHELDGIHMTCDGIGQELKLSSGLLIHGPILHEFKATWKRVRTAAEFEKEWMWLNQGKGYCKGYGPRVVKWHVFYLMGDYRGSGPIYRTYIVEFSNKEVDQAWAMILAHKDEAEEEVGTAKSSRKEN